MSNLSTTKNWLCSFLASPEFTSCIYDLIESAMALEVLEYSQIDFVCLTLHITFVCGNSLISSAKWAKCSSFDKGFQFIAVATYVTLYILNVHKNLLAHPFSFFFSCFIPPHSVNIGLAIFFTLENEKKKK